MTFLELYGDSLDRELGSADRRQLFTTARRKAAINDAQREWVRLTECLTRELTITLTDTVSEYELETRADDFWALAASGPELTQDDGTNTPTTSSGEDFPQRALAWLNREQANWRNESDGTPTAWYLREDGGRYRFGVVPAPDIPSGERWTVRVPYLAWPTDMSADTDEPFTVNSDSPIRLKPYHPALVHYAAAQLEKLRRDQATSDLQMQRFVAYVTDFLQRSRPRAGRHISFARPYRSEVAHGGVTGVGRYAADPWRDP